MQGSNKQEFVAQSVLMSKDEIALRQVNESFGYVGGSFQ